jgi:hypothetical protein
MLSFVDDESEDGVEVSGCMSCMMPRQRSLSMELSLMSSSLVKMASPFRNSSSRIGRRKRLYNEQNMLNGATILYSSSWFSLDRLPFL